MSSPNAHDSTPHPEPEPEPAPQPTQPAELSTAAPPTEVNIGPTPQAIPADQIKKPSEVNRDDPSVNVVELPPRSPTFKERVYGYARVIRGTVLGKPDVKEQGEQVLRGQQTIPLRRGSQSSKQD